MATFLIIALIVGGAILVYSSYISKRGFRIVQCVSEFEEVYEDLAKSGSKQKALQEAFIVFKDCPFVNIINESEWPGIAETLSKAKNPKEVIRVIVIGMPSDKIVASLRDATFLKELVDLSNAGAITDISKWGKGRVYSTPTTPNTPEHIKACPEDAKLHVVRAFGCQSRGENDKALEEFTKAIAIFPRLDTAYLKRGDIYLESGCYDKAVEDYSVYITLSPQDAAAYLSRGRAYQEIGEHAKSAADFEKHKTLSSEQG